ncbi:hypothetical protein J4458_05070 [Candidatus Woesearchaeota archaeon]|nr:hypothetical protein [Candidatus Woesearchaeota archaeon]
MVLPQTESVQGVNGLNPYSGMRYDGNPDKVSIYVFMSSLGLPGIRENFRGIEQVLDSTSPNLESDRRLLTEILTNQKIRDLNALGADSIDSEDYKALEDRLVRLVKSHKTSQAWRSVGQNELVDKYLAILDYVDHLAEERKPAMETKPEVIEKLKKAVIQAFIETYKPSFGTYRPRKKDEEIYLSVYRELQK